MKKILYFTITFFITVFILNNCQTFKEDNSNIIKENEISKRIKELSVLVIEKIYNFSLEENKLIILDFKDLTKRYKYLGTYFADKLFEELELYENIKLLNRYDINLILNELEFQQTGFVNEEDKTNIGKFTGANLIITGNIVDLGDELEIIVNTTMLETIEVKKASLNIKKSNEIMKLISSIESIEQDKQNELNQKIQELENEINIRKSELKILLEEGKKQIEEKLKQEEKIKKEELEKIEQQIREKSNILKTLKIKEQELAQYENEIFIIQQRLSRLNNRLINYLTTGMTINDVKIVLELKNIDIVSGGYKSGGNPWVNAFGTNYISWHGRYAIIWSSDKIFTSDDPVVLGWYDSNDGGCYYRNP